MEGRGLDPCIFFCSVSRSGAFECAESYVDPDTDNFCAQWQHCSILQLGIITWEVRRHVFITAREY
jgi:hypothetical protein